jgi:TetR/AcrR family transcriptional repressor of nem operon
MADVKTERKERSHERIVASAGSLMRERGICGASVADVMRGAGMTVGGFYAHFPSKRELAGGKDEEEQGQSRQAARVVGHGHAFIMEEVRWAEYATKSGFRQRGNGCRITKQDSGMVSPNPV